MCMWLSIVKPAEKECDCKKRRRIRSEKEIETIQNIYFTVERERDRGDKKGVVKMWKRE